MSKLARNALLVRDAIGAAAFPISTPAIVFARVMQCYRVNGLARLVQIGFGLVMPVRAPSR